MALKATRTTGPLAPPSADYSVVAVRLQLRGALEANFRRARSSNFASVQTS
jgi:hypothetical protein